MNFHLSLVGHWWVERSRNFVLERSIHPTQYPYISII
jgi:hypothetical protein